MAAAIGPAKTGLAGSLLIFLLLLSGCFATDDAPATGPVGRPADTTRPGGTGVIKSGGWDDFPNKHRPALEELAAKMTRLPMPHGVLYTVIGYRPPSKRAADTVDCPDGPREIYGLSLPGIGLYMADTIRYYDTAGVVGCKWNSPTIARVTHNRYTLDMNAGEAWEEIVDSVSAQTALPHHSVTGRGRMRLNSRLELGIDEFRVEVVTPFRENESIITWASLKLAWKDGYTMDLELTKSAPYRAEDFFPPAGGPSTPEIMMGGPIRQDGKRIGWLDLLSDHTVVVRDTSGQAVTAP